MGRKPSNNTGIKHVQRIRGKYHARIILPPELRPFFDGKRELVEDLGGDRAGLEKRAAKALGRMHAAIDDAKELLAYQSSPEAAAKSLYRAGLAQDDQARLHLEHSDMETIHKLPIVRARQNYLRMVAEGTLPADKAEKLLGDRADEIQKKLPGMPRADALKMVAEIQLDAFGAALARDEGRRELPEPKLSLLAIPDPDQPAKNRGTGKTLTDIVDAFHRERGDTLTPKTKEEHRVAIRMLEEVLGKDIAARSISRTDMLRFKNVLLDAPANYTKRFPGMTLPQAIKANQKRSEPFPVMHPQTAGGKWLAKLNAILVWAVNNGYLDTNPGQGVRIDTGRREHHEPSRIPFTAADLKAMFSNALFADRKSYGTQQWSLLLALYTGARSAELARIRLADIYEEQGVPCIHLSGATKNARSKRLVPVHDSLVSLGFLDHVERLRTKGKERLFPDWEPEDKINRWFLRSFRKDVGITDGRKLFHSFRHTLKTALAYHGVARDVSDKITGHSDQSVAGVYIHDSMVKAMAEGLNRVKFDLPILPGYC